MGLPRLFQNEVLCEAPFKTSCSRNPKELGAGKGLFIRLLAASLSDFARGGFLSPAQVAGFKTKIEQTCDAVQAMTGDQGRRIVRRP